MKNHKLVFALFICFLFCLGQGFAQIDPETFTPGLNFDEEQTEYIKLPYLPGDFGSKADELPFFTSLKKYCPDPSAQGNIGSCVGWSVGYGAMTILHAQRGEWDKERINSETFSGLFIYNSIRTAGCYGGTTLARAGDFLKESGNCKNKNFTIVPVENCDTIPNSVVQKEAKRYKIKDYYPVFEYGEKGSKKTYLTKKSLANNVPVAIGLRLKRNFAYVNAENPIWNSAAGDTTPWGGHAMVVIGYDDRKEAFHLLNSWGSNWGENGFGWVSYDDFEEYCMFAYQYVLDDELPTEEDVVEEIVKDVEEEEEAEVKKVTMGGNFNFRYPDFANSPDDKILFANVEPTHKSDYFYEMAKKDWSIGDRFQLLVNEMKKGHYIYVFSLDGEGANLHWPRGLSLEEEEVVDGEKVEVVGAGEASLVPYEKVEIIIPGEDRALTKRIEGDDHICLLYCSAPIEDFTDRVKKVQSGEGEFSARFSAGFGDLLIGSDEIDYNKTEMSFTADTKTSATIVPIVLVVEGE